MAAKINTIPAINSPLSTVLERSFRTNFSTTRIIPTIRKMIEKIRSLDIF